MELSNEFSENVNYEPMNGDFRKDDKADITQNVSGEDFALIGNSTFPVTYLYIHVLA
jgi:hypothetical protein